MTNQAPETIIYEGVKYDLRGYALEQHKPKIEFHPVGSFCWRGYRGTWEIRDEKLYLVNLIAWRHDPNSRRMVPQIRVDENADFYMGEREEFDFLELALQDIFPESPAEGVFADWFTGELAIPIDERDEDGQHQLYRVFDFTNGELQSIVIKPKDDVIKPFNRDEFIKQLQEERVNRKNRGNEWMK